MNPFQENGKSNKKIGLGSIFFIVLFAFAIIQFSFVERVIGRYLAKSNFERPLIGQAWTSGLEKELAAGKTFIPELTTGVRGDLAQWFIRAQRGRPTTLTMARFAAQWQRIPTYLTTEVIPMSEWQNLVNNYSVERVRPTVTNKNFILTFLTADNKTVEKFSASEKAIKRIAEHNKTLNDSLKNIKEFAVTYTPNQWNAIWKTLPIEIRQFIWEVIEEDVILHRPVGKYGIIPLDENYSVLWIEYYQPQLVCISYVFPANILDHLK